MKVQVLGCGDAFGSGGRFNTCFHVTAGSNRFLVDCGASSMVAIRRFAVDPNAITTIFISHLHGDHFGGLPFFLLDAQFVSHRSTPLTLAGPPGFRERLGAAMEVLFPGSAESERRFPITIVELEPEVQTVVDGVAVTPFLVRHPSGAPSCALRLSCGGKVLCYTGDTEWVENLVPAAQHADLLIAECFTAERPVPFHLRWSILKGRLGDMHTKRVILTHMSAEMLEYGPVDGAERAEDGLVIEI